MYREFVTYDAHCSSAVAVFGLRRRDIAMIEQERLRGLRSLSYDECLRALNLQMSELRRVRFDLT